MSASKPRKLNQLHLYTKAIDIFKLSRSVVSYISYDKDVLSLANSECKIDQYSSLIIRDALGLAPKIALIEHQKNTNIKEKHALSLEGYINRMYQNSKHLEALVLQGKDFLKLLRKELANFREIHLMYMKSLK
jgi:hypothetical protein